MVARSIRNDEVANMIGEVVDAVGSDGAVLVEDSHELQTRLEYIEGVRWNEGYHSTFLLRSDEGGTSRLQNPRILLTDHGLARAEDLLPTLESCVAAGERSLLIVAPEMSDAAVGLLVVNRERGVLDTAMAVKAPLFGAQRQGVLEDIAAITGARSIIKDRGGTLADVTIEDLGQARQAWATQYAFGILGGRGSKTAIRQRIAETKAELRSVDGDAYASEKIKERIGKLSGMAAAIRVGAPSQPEQEDLRLRIEAALRAARSALDEGVVPGGGAALTACIPAVEGMPLCGDEAVGGAVLAHALAEPMRVIVGNAGLDGATIVHETRRRNAHQHQVSVFDVVCRQWVDPWSGGLVDPLTVALTALETSVRTAALALTSEVLVRRKDPPITFEP
jgi:chaperonin GroEL